MDIILIFKAIILGIVEGITEWLPVSSTGHMILVDEFINLNVSPGKAVDLGCGAGRDTIELLKNNWNVLSIDKEDTESIIREQLNQKESENFKFKKCFFGRTLI